jgi:hypothetical protein
MINYNYNNGDKVEITPNTTYKCINDIYVTSELSFWKGKIYTSDCEGNLSNKRSGDSISKFIQSDFKVV